MIQTGFLLLLCTGAFAQYPGYGDCSGVTGVRNFDFTKFLGVWYELEKYVAFPGMPGICITASYKLNSNGKMEVHHKLINPHNKHELGHKGTLEFVADKKEAKFFVDYSTIKHSQHYILATDYINYAIILSCADPAVSDSRDFWILARQPTLPTKVLETAYKVLDRYKLKRNLLSKTEQKDCPPLHTKQ